MPRAVTPLLAALVCVVVGLAARGAAAPLSMDLEAGPATPAVVPHSQPAKRHAVPHAPASSPAPICGSRSLDGPTSRPKGAVVVRPSQSLEGVVSRHPAGTTFWLRTGTYTFGQGVYDQVTPRDHDRIIGAPGVVIDGRHTNLYAFGGNAQDVTLAYLTVENFGTSITDNQSQGVVNHDAGHGWTMSHLTVRDNAGAGIFLGSGDAIRSSCLVSNGQYGFSAYAATGVSNLRIIHNEIAHNNTADWERRQPGCGCTGGAKFWAVRNATVKNNWVHDNRGPGLWADTDNTGFLFQGNLFARNTSPGVIYETSYNARFVANTFRRNSIVDGPSVGFPEPAIYLSESGSDPRAGSRFGKQLVIARNRFVNNFSGVALWENSNRYAGSPDNSSTTDTTLVNPRVATVSACAQNIARSPYIDDCRWKTQNVKVRHNTFVFDPSAMPASCTADAGCGYVGVFSEWGSLAPFQGDVVPDHIAFDQHNRFSHNVYQGPWRFMGRELGTVLTWKQWRSRPYGQDAGSSRSPLR